MVSKHFLPKGFAMFSVAEELRRARLDQGLDLGTVAARTKIKTKWLEAIEAGDRKSLPGGFFYKSFVHQYALFLGLDTREIDAEIDRVLSADAPLPLPSIGYRVVVERSPRSWNVRTYLSSAALVLILVALSGTDGWWHKSRTAAAGEIESRGPVVENTARRRAPSPVTRLVSLASVSQVAPGSAVAAPAGSEVQLDLTATEDTWVSISSDGKPVFSGLLAASQTKTIESKGYAGLLVGNAAGLEVRLNGKPLGPLGAHGQVRDLLFTPDKFQFVSAPKESE
jgi:cytoskeleton protein RodZ